MNVEINEVISAGSVNATQVVVTNASPSRGVHELMIKVISGSIKFGKGSVNANAHAYAAGETVIITCANGELYFEAASALDTFVVTV